VAKLSALGALDLSEAGDLPEDGVLHMEEFQSKMKSDHHYGVKEVLTNRGF
jgi:hypothetical protein